MNNQEQYQLIFENQKYIYYASSLGYVFRKNKHGGTEKIKSSFMKDGRLAVNIAGKTCFLGQLIAKAFLREYHNTCCVGYKDGNRMNCSADNLYILTRPEEGRKVGRYNNREKGVVVQEGKTIIKYRTIKAASKGLYCSCRTLRDYLKGRYKSSVLDALGRTIYYA